MALTEEVRPELRRGDRNGPGVGCEQVSDLPRSRMTGLLGTLALVLMASAVSGCADLVVDRDKAQDAIEADILAKSDIAVRAVECPEDVPVVAGERFSCQVVAIGGNRYRATLLILDDEADLDFESLERVR